MAHYYFDNAATTPVSPSVIQAMLPVLQTTFGNPSSIHYFGRQAHQLLDHSRQTIAQSIHAHNRDEIVFTSGGTESDNTAILSTAHMYRHLGRHIITTKIEHPAVLETMKQLAAEGYQITYLPVDERGCLSLADFKAALRPDTILVSVMMANNEVGALEPIEKIGQILQSHQAVFHTDAVQAYGLVDIDVQALGVDLLSVSGHKLHGPKGTGFLYISQQLKFHSLLRGGEQEKKRRAGTENMPGIVGMAQAVSDLDVGTKKKKYRRFFSYKENLVQSLQKQQVDFEINGPDIASGLPHVLNIWLKGVPTTVALMNLDLLGFAVSGGSACAAGSLTPSHVLVALYGPNSPRVKESLRISFGSENDLDSVKKLGQAIGQVYRDYLVHH